MGWYVSPAGPKSFLITQKAPQPFCPCLAPTVYRPRPETLTVCGGAPAWLRNNLLLQG